MIVLGYSLIGVVTAIGFSWSRIHLGDDRLTSGVSGMLIGSAWPALLLIGCGYSCGYIADKINDWWISREDS